MIYVAGRDLGKNKSVFVALKNIYGLGNFKSMLICSKLGISENRKTKDLSDIQINKINKFLDFYEIPVEADLKQKTRTFTKRLVDIKSRRGLRQVYGLPVRGQRTHTNAKISKKLSYKN